MTNFSIIWTASVRETASASVMTGFPRLLLLQRSRRGAHPHQDVPGSLRTARPQAQKPQTSRTRPKQQEESQPLTLEDIFGGDKK